jgi:protein phosphatase
MADPVTITIEAHAQSDVGRVRNNNEDSVYLDDEARYAVLADGMGGANAGEVASALAVDCFRAAFDELSEDEWRSFDTVLDVLHRATEDAHRQILEQAAAIPTCAGMGSTLVAVARVDARLLFVHVGDSRLYRWQDGQLQQLTKDHSLVQQQFDLGLISAEEKRHSKHKNIITHALGVSLGSDIHWREIPLVVGQQILLCSDGLTDMLRDEEIAAILHQTKLGVAERCAALVDSANAKGGRDNISVVLLEVRAANGHAKDGFFQQKWREFFGR